VLAFALGTPLELRPKQSQNRAPPSFLGVSFRANAISVYFLKATVEQFG
jgi:hypothetical protein